MSRGVIPKNNGAVSASSLRLSPAYRIGKPMPSSYGGRTRSDRRCARHAVTGTAGRRLGANVGRSGRLDAVPKADAQHSRRKYGFVSRRGSVRSNDRLRAWSKFKRAARHSHDRSNQETLNDSCGRRRNHHRLRPRKAIAFTADFVRRTIEERSDANEPDREPWQRSQA